MSINGASKGGPRTIEHYKMWYLHKLIKYKVKYICPDDLIVETYLYLDLYVPRRPVSPRKRCRRLQLTSGPAEVTGIYGLTKLSELLNKIYLTGVWPRNFFDMIIIVLEKKPPAKKDHQPLLSHTGKIKARILNRRLECRIDQYIAKKLVPV